MRVMMRGRGEVGRGDGEGDEENRISRPLLPDYVQREVKVGKAS